MEESSETLSLPLPLPLQGFTSSSILSIEERHSTALRQLQRYLITGQFQKALAEGNAIITDCLKDPSWDGPVTYFQTTWTLALPLVVGGVGVRGTGTGTGDTAQQTQTIEWGNTSSKDSASQSFQFQVRLGTQLTLVDHVASMALQAWHELDRQETTGTNAATRSDSTICPRQAWTHLQPILELYSEHPMPLQVCAELWLPFWQSRIPHLALAWNVQLCVCLRSQQQQQQSSTFRQALLERLLIEQVPWMVADTNLARRIVQAVLFPCSQPLPSPSPSPSPLPSSTTREFILVEEDLQSLFESAAKSLLVSSSSDTIRAIRQVLLLAMEAKKREDNEDFVLLQRLLDHPLFSIESTSVSSAAHQAVERGISQSIPGVQQITGDATTTSTGSSLPSILQRAATRYSLLCSKRIQALLPSSMRHLLETIRVQLTYQSRLLLRFGIQTTKESASIRTRAVGVVAWSVLSLLLLWLACKKKNKNRQRHLLRSKFGPRVMALLLTPLTELVEALRPTTSRPLLNSS